MGHHPMPRTHANKLGFPLLGTHYDSPSWYPYKVEGSDILHRDMHSAVKDAGVPFNSKFTGTPEELIEKLDHGYSGFKERGYVKIPRTGEIIAKNVTIQGALHKSLKWNKQKLKGGGCNG